MEHVDMEMLIRTRDNARLNEQLRHRPLQPDRDALKIQPPMPLRRELPEDYEVDMIFRREHENYEVF